MNHKFTLILPALALTLASLACTMFIGGPELPQATIPVSTEIAGSVQEQVKQAVESAAQNGTLTLSISESQLSSLLAVKLQSQPDPFITEPQVLLRNGEIQVYGKAISGSFQANVRIVLSATIDANGQPQITVTSTDFGPLPAPEGLNNSISAVVNEAFTGALGPAATGFRLENITIADGMLTLTGRIK
jgi:uncharacterized protein YpmS